MEAFTLVILHCFATNPIPLFSFSKRHKDFQWDFPALENLPKSILPRVELKRSITIISFEQGKKKIIILYQSWDFCAAWVTFSHLGR